MLGELEGRGFALVPEVIGLEQVHDLIGVIERIQRTLTPDQSNYGMRHILRVPEIRDLAKSPAVLELVKQILGPRAFPVRGIFFDKTPDANWKVAWHQDLTITVKEKHDVEGFSAWSRKEEVWHVQPPVEILENMVTARLHLDDCDETNGPLQVVSGSHQSGRLTAQMISEFRDARPVVTCTAQKGDALLMRPLLLHASSPAKTAKHRRVIHIEFAADDLPASLQWHG